MSAQTDTDSNDQSFPKSARVLTTRQFQHVFGSGFFAANELLVCNIAANGLQGSRLGLSISRKVGNAVVRNRWKRAIREAFRHQRHRLPTGVDLVLRPRAGAIFDRPAINDALTDVVIRAARKMNRARSTGPLRAKDNQRRRRTT